MFLTMKRQRLMQRCRCWRRHARLCSGLHAQDPERDRGGWLVRGRVGYLAGLRERHRVHYVRQPFHREPDFGVTSVNYDFGELLARAEAPK